MSNPLADKDLLRGFWEFSSVSSFSLVISWRKIKGGIKAWSARKRAKNGKCFQHQTRAVGLTMSDKILNCHERTNPLKLLEKAHVLAQSRMFGKHERILIDEDLRRCSRAAKLLLAPEIPGTETDALRKAKVELETDLPAAQLTLEGILVRNKACAQAYLLWRHG